MFDRIMENTMAMWMLVSALFPIFVFGTLIKAVLHFRRLRALEREDAREVVSAPMVGGARAETEDWVPSR